MKGDIWIKVAGIAVWMMVTIFIIIGCGVKPYRQYDENIFALDTILTFKVYGHKGAKEALDQSIKRIREIEKRMSAMLSDSDVSKINNSAGKQPIKVHDDTFYVIQKALEYGRLTQGVFDITIRPIVELWDITSENPRVPSEEEIKEILPLIDYKKISLNVEEKTVYLEEEGMAIDLGAIAKGYAADEAARILKEAGVRHALINLGGNILVIGNKPEGELWRIGLQDPRADETGNKHFSIVELADKTIVSSGDYERYMVDIYKETGVRYHHIFDPKTGIPAQSGLVTCTIIAESSIHADALSTSFFIMGMEKGFEMVKGMEDIQAIAVTLDKEVYTTEGLKGKLIPSNDQYRIMD